MDSLTHIVLGGCLGQLTLGKKVGRKAVVWGAIADTVPDLDVFVAFFVHPVDSLLSHRGFTHSILFAFLFSLVGGKILAYLYAKDHIPWYRWALLLALGTGSHLFIDSLTNYGTGLLEPFCNHRFSYTTIFIADPLFTLPMLIAFVVLMRKKALALTKYRFAKIALILAGCYLSWTFYNRITMESFFNQQFRNQTLRVTHQSITPGPLNNLLWGTVARSDSGYYFGSHSIMSDAPNVDFTYVPAQDHLAAGLEHQIDYLKLKRFAKGYHCISILEDGIPYFHDLRFGSMHGWAKPIGDFNFNYPLVRDSAITHRLIKTNPWNKGKFDGFGGLWSKILGRE